MSLKSVDIPAPQLNRGLLSNAGGSNLKQKSVRGGAVVVVSQALRFVLQTGSVMILARLLSPNDFGLQGMVVAMTGVLTLFRDVGLSSATVQRDEVTHEQVSTLFWINVLVGVILMIFGAAMAPLLATFYKEPRLFWVTIVSSVPFLLNGLAVQHQALLNRNMRFVTLATIDVLSLALSSAVGIGMAMLGYGYWSLVGLAVSGSLISSVAPWAAISWRPGKPSRRCGVWSMLHFGSTITLNSVVVYVSYNMEKVLLGRFWGADALGLYGRAYQLANLPVQQLNQSIGSVAFPALSRIQGDAERLRHSFLKGYSVLVSITIPVTLSCAVFAEEVIHIVLGPKWTSAAPVLRLLAPTVLAFALVNPFGWFLMATGRAGRSLRIAFLIMPVVLFGIVAGLSGGPKGVALGYSIAMVLLVVPIVAWATRGTGITMGDYWKCVRQPLLAGLLAGAVGLAFKNILGESLPAIPTLFLGVALSVGIYAWILLFVIGQKDVYVDLLNQLFRRPNFRTEEPAAESSL